MAEQTQHPLLEVAKMSFLEAIQGQNEEQIKVAKETYLLLREIREQSLEQTPRLHVLNKQLENANKFNKDQAQWLSQAVYHLKGINDSSETTSIKASFLEERACTENNEDNAAARFSEQWLRGEKWGVSKVHVEVLGNKHKKSPNNPEAGSYSNSMLQNDERRREFLVAHCHEELTNPSLAPKSDSQAIEVGRLAHLCPSYRELFKVPHPEVYENFKKFPIPEGLQAMLSIMQPLNKSWRPVSRQSNYEMFFKLAERAELLNEAELDLQAPFEEKLMKCPQAVVQLYREAPRAEGKSNKMHFSECLCQFYQFSIEHSEAAFMAHEAEYYENREAKRAKQAAEDGEFRKFFMDFKKDYAETINAKPANEQRIQAVKDAEWQQQEEKKAKHKAAKLAAKGSKTIKSTQIDVDQGSWDPKADEPEVTAVRSRSAGATEVTKKLGDMSFLQDPRYFEKDQATTRAVSEKLGGFSFERLAKTFETSTEACQYLKEAESGQVVLPSVGLVPTRACQLKRLTKNNPKADDDEGEKFFPPSSPESRKRKSESQEQELPPIPATFETVDEGAQEEPQTLEVPDVIPIDMDAEEADEDSQMPSY